MATPQASAATGEGAPLDPEIKYYHWGSYYLSRFNYVAVHLFTVFVWFQFLLNDPFGLGVNTLDAKVTKPADKCVRFDWTNARFDLALWLLWWAQHSTMARKRFKQAVGLLDHPLERPLFGLASCITLSIWTLFWRPVSDCARFEPLKTPLWMWAINGTVVALCLALILSYFWIMPGHVFGTDRYVVYAKPQPHSIYTGYPYGMVRHPAATGFLWLFWFWPSYTTNHIFYAALWTIFILIGTTFEEGGISGAGGEFEGVYQRYRTQVGMFFPRLAWFRGQKVDLSKSL